jgi:hypothetical protein
MEKETSICNELDGLSAVSDMKERAKSVIELLNRKLGIEAYFCEVKGKRWSYCVGNEEISYPLRQYVINEKWGLVTEDVKIDQNKWYKILQSIQNLFNQSADNK